MKAKLNIENELNVTGRIRAVMQLRLIENPTEKISISEVCRLAKVNRAGLYAHHPELVDEIRGRNKALHRESSKTTARVEKREPLFSSKATDALLYLCLELQMEVKALRAVVPSPPAKRKVRA